MLAVINWSSLWSGSWPLLACLLVVVLLLLVIYLLAQHDLFFCFVEEGDFRFIMKGKNLHRIILNARGYYLDEDDVVQVGQDASKTWLNRHFGIYWVGIPPFFRIHRWVFEYETRSDQDAFQTKPESVILSALHLFHTYRLVVKEAELKDAFRIDTTSNLVVKVINPRLAVLTLKGKWFVPLMTAAKGAVADLINNYRYKTDGTRKGKKESWLELNKEGAASTFSTAITDVNSEIGKITGVVIESVDYQDFQPSAEQEDVIKATQALEKARLEGEAKLETAKFNAQATRVEGEADNEIALGRKNAVGEKVMVAQAMADTAKNFVPPAGGVLTIGGQAPIGTYPVQ